MKRRAFFQKSLSFLKCKINLRVYLAISCLMIQNSINKTLFSRFVPYNIFVYQYRKMQQSKQVKKICKSIPHKELSIEDQSTQYPSSRNNIQNHYYYSLYWRANRSFFKFFNQTSRSSITTHLPQKSALNLGSLVWNCGPVMMTAEESLKKLTYNSYLSLFETLQGSFFITCLPTILWLNIFLSGWGFESSGVFDFFLLFIMGDLIIYFVFFFLVYWCSLGQIFSSLIIQVSVFYFYFVLAFQAGRTGALYQSILLELQVFFSQLGFYSCTGYSSSEIRLTVICSFPFFFFLLFFGSPSLRLDIDRFKPFRRVRLCIQLQQELQQALLGRPNIRWEGRPQGQPS